MSPKPPDILRKSHRHTERDERATAKLELRRELAEATAETAALHRYRGSCTCGAIGYVYSTRAAAANWPVRRCACTFCAPLDALYTSDPAGRIELRIDDPAFVEHRRFARENADCLTCRRCGDFVAAVTLGTDEPRAIANLRLLEDPPPLPDAELVEYDDETATEPERHHGLTWAPLGSGTVREDESV